mmetsp:Transcript_5952/g.13056  ORF Transcript_5952/g.13056 Transcript_5952/m.13056 type:complete len:211 (-) Transcript_5952:574-1206(-)
MCAVHDLLCRSALHTTRHTCALGKAPLATFAALRLSTAVLAESLAATFSSLHCRLPCWKAPSRRPCLPTPEPPHDSKKRVNALFAVAIACIRLRLCSPFLLHFVSYLHLPGICAWRLRVDAGHRRIVSVVRHFLQADRLRPCAQKLVPPHSLHWDKIRLCSQMLAPSHSAHLHRRRPCSQKALPPHSLHWLRLRPCSQMPAPPHSLHEAR